MAMIESATVPQLLTSEQAAQALAVCRKTLYRLTKPRGPIAVVRIGHAVRYSTATLAEYIRSQELDETKR
jgi:excisionase family DNA binding protein